MRGSEYLLDPRFFPLRNRGAPALGVLQVTGGKLPVR